MAINIFSGSSGSRKNSANSAQRSTRAKQAKATLTTPNSEVSDSGNTAVGAKGTLQKVGNVIGTIGNIAGKFLPGIGGTIGKVVGNLFNDPEWWQSVPGDALSLNDPLRFIDASSELSPDTARVRRSTRSAILEFFSTGADTSTVDTPTGSRQVPLATKFRTVGIATGVYSYRRYGNNWTPFVQVSGVMTPTEHMVTQYLMPQIRKVVNAIPLQSASEYNTVIRVNSTIYAMWRQLKKVDYMCKHGQTYLASMNDDAFPLFKTENAAWLQSTINRLEEYLRANVRLPHTLCEYLAWRYGRVYKSNSSGKSALVLHNVLPLACEPSVWDACINVLMNRISTSEYTQKANTDVYNTYYDHDYMVEVRDDTQFKYDIKEFLLRLNLEGSYLQVKDDSTTISLGAPGGTAVAQFSSAYIDVVPAKVKSCIVLDSALDNPTTFMASTVSAGGKDQSGQMETLFPTSRVANVYIPMDNAMLAQGAKNAVGGYTAVCINVTDKAATTQNSSGATVYDVVGAYIWKQAESLTYQGQGELRGQQLAGNLNSKLWAYGIIDLDQLASENGAFDVNGVMNKTDLLSSVADLITGKAVDLYNYGTLFDVAILDGSGIYQYNINLNGSGGLPADVEREMHDYSQLSIDAGSPTATTLNTEHVYAFANLVDIERKHSMSYKQAEHLVAKDTANLIDTLDVGAVADSR